MVIFTQAVSKDKPKLITDTKVAVPQGSILSSMATIVLAEVADKRYAAGGKANFIAFDEEPSNMERSI